MTHPLNKLVDLSEVRGNILNISELRQIYAPRLGGKLTLRYVSNGLESYQINGSKYEVASGEYLISNLHSQGSVLIDSKTVVKGICIDLSEDLVSEVFSKLSEPAALEVVTDLKDSLYGPNFLEGKYRAQQTNVGGLLQQLERSVFDPGITLSPVNIDFFYGVCERLVSDYLPIQSQLNKLKSIKHCTRKNLLKRLYKGKELLDDLFLSNPSIEVVARECGISQYHFFRLFKNTFGISPHQYVLQKRLLFAQKELLTNKHSISEIAFHCGYADIQSFSKAFKKFFGVNPTIFRK